MAHISIGEYILDSIGFLQNESTNTAIVTTHKTLNPHHHYLDSTSSFHQVFTKEHLDHFSTAGINLHQDLFHIWLVCNSIANLLSLPQLEDTGFTISYHTGGKWIVTNPQGKDITFHCKSDGVCRSFPYLNMQSTLTVAMVQTTRQRYEGFMKCKVPNAMIPCKGQAMTGHPSNAQFQAMMRSNTIKNCPMKPKHIANANSIFGLSIAGVRGKTTHCKPNQVEAAPGRIPDDFHHLHKFIVLTTDVMFVNGIAFLTTLLQKLRLATVEQLPTCAARQLDTSLTKIVQLYARTGFIVKVVMMDQEFDKIKDKINMVEINTTPACKHIERFIQMTKVRSQALVSDLLYSLLP
jgi:hypothetical protein